MIRRRHRPDQIIRKLGGGLQFKRADGCVRKRLRCVQLTIVMGILASAGRNDPCPCGSGRKAKQCHQQLRTSTRSGT